MFQDRMNCQTKWAASAALLATLVLALPAQAGDKELLAKVGNIILNPKSTAAELRQCQTDISRISPGHLNSHDQFQLFFLEYRLAVREKRLEAAVSLALKSYEKRKDSRSARLVGHGYALQNKFGQAAPWFDTAAKLSNGDPVLLAKSAQFYKASGQTERAKQIFSEISKQHPHNPAIRLIEASSEASPETKKKLLLSISDADCTNQQRFTKYCVLAQTCASQGDHTSALRYAKIADAISSTPATWNLLGVSNYFLKRYADAEPWLRKYLASDGRVAESWVHLAVCRADAGHLPEAIALCTRALKVNSTCLLALRKRGGFYYRSDQTTLALADLERLRKLDPGHPHTLAELQSQGFYYTKNVIQYVQKAAAGWQAEDQAKMAKLQTLIKTTEDDQERMKLLQQLAEVQIVCGQYDAALASLQTSITLGNNSYRVHSLKAAALYGLKRLPEAKAERELTVVLHSRQEGEGKLQ